MERDRGRRIILDFENSEGQLTVDSSLQQPPLNTAKKNMSSTAPSPVLVQLADAIDKGGLRMGRCTVLDLASLTVSNQSTNKATSPRPSHSLKTRTASKYLQSLCRRDLKSMFGRVGFGNWTGPYELKLVHLDELPLRFSTHRPHRTRLIPPRFFSINASTFPPNLIPPPFWTRSRPNIPTNHPRNRSNLAFRNPSPRNTRISRYHHPV